MDQIDHGRGDLRSPGEQSEQVERSGLAGGAGHSGRQFGGEHRHGAVGVRVSDRDARLGAGGEEGIGDPAATAGCAEEPVEMGPGQRGTGLDRGGEFRHRGGARSELRVEGR
jgi:hypothetical protein